jgi:hypothetical protein
VGCIADALVLNNETNLLRLGEQPRWFITLLLCLPEVPGFLFMFLCSWINHRRRKRDRPFMCPHCDTSLFFSSGLVKATGNCCFCGRRVLAETEKTRESEVNPSPNLAPNPR